MHRSVPSDIEENRRKDPRIWRFRLCKEAVIHIYTTSDGHALLSAGQHRNTPISPDARAAPPKQRSAQLAW